LVDVVVTGIGLVSALGTLKPSWQSLLVGESGIGLCQPFLELPKRPLAIVEQKPATLKWLTQQAVAAAIEDANIPTPAPDCGVVIGSSRGAQATWEQLAQECVLTGTPTPSAGNGQIDWLDTLPHQGAIAAAHQIGATGIVLAPMAACATGIWAIAQGFELIQTNQCQRVIAGAVEAPITPLTLAGFHKMGALARTGSYPFDRQREGLVLGEGGAVLVLESAELARERSAAVYGQILGFGLTADAYHVSAPDPNRKSAIAAVWHCLKRSHLAPTDIDYIHAHGTGTQLNDQHEAQLIEKVFARKVPVSSTKGATGHTLGASGALGTALCLMSLKHQILPPNVGLTESAFDLDLIATPRHSQIRHALCFSFGFGGQNAVLSLKRWKY
jgi:3-oxoacyl-[acyl-carrier-protein] synthase II